MELKTIKDLIHVGLWIGFFVAGCIITHAYHMKIMDDTIEDILGQALDKDNACINFDLLDENKLPVTQERKSNDLSVPKSPS